MHGSLHAIKNKKMKALQILIFFFISISSCISHQKSNKLIHREDFFLGEVRIDFKIDSDASHLFYRVQGRDSVLFFCSTKNPNKIENLKYFGKVLQYEILNDNVLAIIKNDSFKLYYNNENIELPKQIQNLKTLQIIDNKSVALQILSPNKKTSGIYSFNPKTGLLIKKYELQPYSKLFFDKDFNFVAANKTNSSGGNTILYYEDGYWHSLVETVWDVDMMLGGFSKVISVTNNGNKIYYTNNKNTDKSNLYVYDKENKKVTLLASNKIVDLLPFGASINSNGEVTSVVGLYAKTIRENIDSNTANDFLWLSKKIKGDIGFIQSSENNQKWLLREFTGGPANIYLYNRKTKNLSLLLTDYPLLENKPLASRKNFTIKSRDGLNLPVHVYLPPQTDSDENGIPKKPLPTIMYVHGGPWVGIVHWNQYYHWRNYQLLANRGYAVIVCEFRGSTGLGKKFTEKSIKVWGTNMTNDKTDIANWAIKNKIAIPNKIGLWGWSYGGYAALAGLAFEPDLYACGVSMYGITDLENFIKTPFADNNFWKNVVGNPYDSTEVLMLREQSPINYVDKIKSPVLLTTGSLDKRVPQVQVDRMANLLHKQNKDVVYFYYPDEGHDYIKPETWISFWSLTEQFLKANLGGKSQHIKDDFNSCNNVVVYDGGYLN